MAMKEIKTFSVKPGEEEVTITLWQTFGWELKGAPQEIYNKDSHLEVEGDDLYNVTTTTHYVKLSFERNPERPNYDELKSLETQYYELKNPYDPSYDKPKLLFGFILTIVFIILWFLSFNIMNKSGAMQYLGIGIAIIIPTVSIIRLVLYPKRRKIWKEDCEKYSKELSAVNAKKEEIISKAQSLI